MSRYLYGFALVLLILQLAVSFFYSSLIINLNLQYRQYQNQIAAIKNELEKVRLQYYPTASLKFLEEQKKDLFTNYQPLKSLNN